MLKEQKVNKKRISFPYDPPRNYKGLAIISLLLLLALIVSACGYSTSTTISNTPRNTPAPGNTTGKTPTVAPAQADPTPTTQTSTTYPVKVYFSRLPLSNTDFNAVFPVDRSSPTSSTGTFAIQQLIAGPNAAESTLGYFSEVKNHLVGPSSCPPDATKAGFTLSLNTKGTTSEPGTATLKFCQQFASAGIGTDARAIAEIDTTLKQFSSIKKVVILTQDSHCFGDESGADVCLH